MPCVVFAVRQVLSFELCSVQLCFIFVFPLGGNDHFSVVGAVCFFGSESALCEKGPLSGSFVGKVPFSSSPLAHLLLPLSTFKSELSETSESDDSQPGL